MVGKVKRDAIVVAELHLVGVMAVALFKIVIQLKGVFDNCCFREDDDDDDKKDDIKSVPPITSFFHASSKTDGDGGSQQTRRSAPISTHRFFTERALKQTVNL